MKICHTLLAILVARWARCGDGDGKGALKGAEKQNPPELPKPEEPVNPFLDKEVKQKNNSYDDFEILYKAQDSSSTPENTTAPASAQSNGGSTAATLDLANPNLSILRVFNIRIKGIPARLYLVTRKIGTNVFVRQIMSNGKNVWFGGNGKSCLYCIAFFKEEIDMVATMIKEAYKIYKDLRENGTNGWQLSTENNDTKIGVLKTITGEVVRFSIDTSLVKNEKCS
ncbi:signal peptide containing protein [Theileria equi strain WA]|uniref:Signal peptide containing protein n=1 Tax=Theileria equi strain WA TaxID=1537102 RepID=L1LAV3_THEEQ|nr:signal peptide containing protein [Theileria equi strain WA]EKX72592.1 signal peptide containing protein [Theileria equi strain WA]|eukprot:XP_004832044.1 signal peptide containing protein [Theileria equi strain WA]